MAAVITSHVRGRHHSAADGVQVRAELDQPLDRGLAAAQNGGIHERCEPRLAHFINARGVGSHQPLDRRNIVAMPLVDGLVDDPWGGRLVARAVGGR